MKIFIYFFKIKISAYDIPVSIVKLGIYKYCGECKNVQIFSGFRADFGEYFAAKILSSLLLNAMHKANIYN